MAYQTYITEALVCGAMVSKTSDKSYLLFTREAGMLFGSARSVREERSRQRYALQECAYIRVSLIKGKAGWRIGSVEPKVNYYHQATDKAARGSVIAIFRHLRRFIHGEESHAELFDFVANTLEFISGEVTDRQFVDSVIQVRLLHLLGYVSEKTMPTEILSTSLSDMSEIQSDTINRRLDRVLKDAVTASHL